MDLRFFFHLLHRPARDVGKNKKREFHWISWVSSPSSFIFIGLSICGVENKKIYKEDSFRRGSDSISVIQGKAESERIAEAHSITQLRSSVMSCRSKYNQSWVEWGETKLFSSFPFTLIPTEKKTTTIILIRINRLTHLLSLTLTIFLLPIIFQ